MSWSVISIRRSTSSSSFPYFSPIFISILLCSISQQGVSIQIDIAHVPRIRYPDEAVYITTPHFLLGDAQPIIPFNAITRHHTAVSGTRIRIPNKHIIPGSLTIVLYSRPETTTTTSVHSRKIDLKIVTESSSLRLLVRDLKRRFAAVDGMGKRIATWGFVRAQRPFLKSSTLLSILPLEKDLVCLDYILTLPSHLFRE